MARRKLGIVAALCGLLSSAHAQLPSGSCYLTSTIIYGDQSTWQTFSSMSLPTFSASVSLSTGSGPSSSTTSTTTGSSTIASMVSSSSFPSLASQPFYIQAVDVLTKTKRDLRYVAFNGDGDGTDAIFISTKDGAAIFMISTDGYLMTGQDYAGTYVACSEDCSMALQKSAEDLPFKPFNWANDGVQVTFGNATFCDLSNTVIIVYGGAGPVDGCAPVFFVPASVPITSTSTITTMSSITSTSQSLSTPETSTSLISSAISLSTASETSSSAVASSPGSPSQPSSLASSSSASRPPPSSSPAASSSIVPSSSGPTTSSSPTSSVSTQSSNSTTSLAVSLLTPTSRSLFASSSSTSATLTSTQPSSSSSGSALTSLSHSSSSSTSRLSPAPASSLVSSSLSTPSTTQPSTPLPTSISTSASTSNSASTSASSSTSNSRSSSSSAPSSSPLTTLSLSTSSSTSAFTFTTLSSSSTSSSTSPSSTPAILPGKRGLAYANVNFTNFYQPPTQVSWAYNYYYAPNSSSSPGIYPYTPTYPLHFIPLLFNDDPSLAAAWPSAVSNAIAHYGTDALFSFNEPDLCVGGSACMSVARAITAYNKSMQPFAGTPGLRLVAPAVTNAGSGFTWLTQFLGNATLNNLTVDVINIHWYASPYNMDYFVQYMQNASVIAAGRPVWITEYGMDNPNYYEPHVEQFMKNTTYWCDQQSFIERYAWFGDYTNNLLNSNGSALSARGQIWNSYVGSGYVELNSRVAGIVAEAKEVEGGSGAETGTGRAMDPASWQRGGFVEKMWWKQDGHMDGK